jgi:hypothetical protein
MPKVVYVGEPGGQNTDVAHETGGKASFEPGDSVEVSEDLAGRLDASWATEEEASERGIEPREAEAEASESEGQANEAEASESGAEAEGGAS